MESVNVTARVDKNLKMEAETLFSDLGLNMSTAINMFLVRCVAEQGLPFDVKKANKVSFPSRELLKSISDDSMKEFDAAYKELAK